MSNVSTMTATTAFRQVQRESRFGEHMAWAGPEPYLNIAQAVARYVPQGGTILDFGAGTGDKTAVVALCGYQCTAVDDLNDAWCDDDDRTEILESARHFGIDYKVLDGTLPQGEFDMIMLHDVLEHLHDSPRDLLNDLLELLKPGGYLFITVPNAANLRKRVALLLGRTNLPRYPYFYWYPNPWRGHVREYVRDDLIKLASYLGLEISELGSCHHMLRILPPAVRAVWRAITWPFPGLQDTWLMVAQKPPGWTSRKNLSPEELGQALNWAGEGSPWRYGRPDKAPISRQNGRAS